MPRIPFPGFCGPSNPQGFPANAASLPFDAQQSINLYPERNLYPQGRGFEYSLIGRPGLASNVLWTLASTPVRALWAGYGRLFAVSGTHFYELNSAGGVLTDYGAMAGSTGTGPAYINQNAGGSSFQLTIVDSSSNQLYTPLAGPTIPSQFNATYQEYLDGYTVAIAAGASLANAGQPNQINVSKFGDPTTWNWGAGATNVFAIVTGGNSLVNALAVLNSQLWIFRQKQIEIWYDAGLSPFPFARYQGATIDLGCIAPASVAKFYNTVMWLGADDRGYAQVYMAKGMSPVRVSTAAIEGLLESGSPQLLPNATAYGYQEAGHTFYCLNPTGNGSSQFVYDLTEGLWHQRNYAGAIPYTFASVPSFNSGGPNFVGDALSGKVVFQGITFANDLGLAGINYTRFAPYVSQNGSVVKHRRFELVGNSVGAAPLLGYSNDQGITYKSSLFNLAAPGGDAGWPVDQPTYQRFYAQQLGRSRARVYRVSIPEGASSTNLIRIAGAYLDVEAGQRASTQEGS